MIRNLNTAFVSILILFYLIFSNSYGETLNELIERAKQNNPQLKKIEKELSIAKQKVKFAGRLLNPSLRLSTEGKKVIKKPVEALFIEFRQEFIYPAKLSLRKDIEKRNYEILYLSLKSQELVLMKQIKEEAYSLWLINEKSHLLDKYIKSLRNLIKLLENKKFKKTEDRLIVKSDTSKLKIVLYNLQKEKITLDARKKVKIASLKKLVNYNIKGDVQVNLKFPQVYHDLELYKLFLKQYSPVLQSVEQNLKKIRLEYELSKKFYYPDFDITFRYSLRSNFWDGIGANIKMNLPIWKKFDEELIVLEEESKVATIKERWQDSFNNLYFSLEENYYKLKEAEKKYQFINRYLVYESENNLKLTTKAYLEHKVDVINLISAINTKISVDMERLEEIYNANLALLNIYQLIDITYF